MFESYLTELIRIFKLTFAYGLLVVGLIIALGCGLWWAFIGGIFQLIEAINMNPIEILEIGASMLRILFSYFVGYLTGGVFYMPAMEIINRNDKSE